MEKMRSIRPDEIEIRVKGAGKYSENVTWLLYKTARVDAAILTEAFGLFGWQNKYYRVGNSLVCAIGIYDVEKKEWVWKSDIGEETKKEPVKGEASDAFKRAGFKWGIGVQLYNAPRISLDPSYDYVDIDCIELDDNRITKLILKSNGEIIFDWTYGKGNAVKKTSKPAPAKAPAKDYQSLMKEAREVDVDFAAVKKQCALMNIPLEPNGDIPADILVKAIKKKRG